MLTSRDKKIINYIHIRHLLGGPGVTEACALLGITDPGSNASVTSPLLIDKSFHVSHFSFLFHEIRGIAYLTSKSKVLYIISHKPHEKGPAKKIRLTNSLPGALCKQKGNNRKGLSSCS